MNPTIQGLVNDSPSGEDRLAVTYDTRILSRLILSRLTEPPLSIGVFGEHGSGRSFFLHLMQRDLADHAGASDLDLVNVKFNALLNVETNPWIALVDAIYLALERDVVEGTASLSPRERDRLFTGLGGTAKRLRALEAARVEQAAATYLEAIRDYRAARRKHQRNLARLADSVSWQRWQVIEQQYWGKQIKGDEAAIDNYGGRLGVEDLSRKPEELHSLLNQAKSIEGIAGLVSASITAAPMLGKLTLLLAFVLLAAGLGGIGFLLKDLFPDGKDFLDAAGKTLGIAGTVSGAIGVLVLVFMRNRARDAINRLRKFVDNLRNAERDADSKHSLDEALIEEDVAVSRDVLAKQREHMQSARGAYQSARQAYGKFLEPGILRRVIEFYRHTLVADANLGAGIVPVLREDIAALTRWLSMEDTPPRSVGAAEADVRRPGRVVVYIDDFDRCPPEHVFNIMQATNLLLSTPLFVVVMIMDPTMALRALEPTYRDLLGEESALQAGRTGSSAIDYLSRLIQVPFWLRKPERREIDAFLGYMLQPFEGPPAEQLPEEGAELVGDTSIDVFETEPGYEEAPHPTPIDVDNIFTSRDLEIVKGLMTVTQVTPRTVKRFVNLCRLALAELRTYDGCNTDDFDAVAALLAIVVGFPLEAPGVFRMIEQGQPMNMDRLIHGIAELNEIPGASVVQIREILRAYSNRTNAPDAFGKLRAVYWLAARHSFNVPPALELPDAL